jgi:hypothetical protein
MDGGGRFTTLYKDTREPYGGSDYGQRHVCYVDGVECFANEARFGGIVIEMVKVKAKRKQESKAKDGTDTR